MELALPTHCYRVAVRIVTWKAIIAERGISSFGVTLVYEALLRNGPLNIYIPCGRGAGDRAE